MDDFFGWDDIWNILDGLDFEQIGKVMLTLRRHFTHKEYNLWLETPVTVELMTCRAIIMIDKYQKPFE